MLSLPAALPWSLPASLTAKFADSARIITRAFDEFGAGLGVCVSGGKDALVVADIAIRTHAAQGRAFPLSFYHFELPRAFPEIAAALARIDRHWGIRVTRVRAPSLRAGLAAAVARDGVRAVLLGTRATDPAAHSEPFAETSPGWPRATRVCPILRWSFRDIWAYIDAAGLPVCSLYERGFTSIGDADTTCPNPRIARPGGAGYRHARELADELAERSGRGARPVSA
jgi:FAD synthetase